MRDTRSVRLLGTDLHIEDVLRAASADRVRDVQTVGHAQEWPLPGAILGAGIAADGVDRTGLDLKATAGPPRHVLLQDRLRSLAIEEHVCAQHVGRHARFWSHHRWV